MSAPKVSFFEPPQRPEQSLEISTTNFRDAEIDIDAQRGSPVPPPERLTGAGMVPIAGNYRKRNKINDLTAVMV